MAEPNPTYVVRVTAGHGAPQTLPLVRGRKQAPLSIGKSGMWRVMSPGILDVHAFLYFDGEALFLQSASIESYAVANGKVVDASWTEIHAPCTFELGDARLEYRDASATDEDSVTSDGTKKDAILEDSTDALPQAPVRSTAPSVRPVEAPKPAIAPKGSRPPPLSSPSKAPSLRPPSPAQRGVARSAAIRPTPQGAPSSRPSSGEVPSPEPSYPAALAPLPSIVTYPDDPSDSTRVSPLETKPRTGPGTAPISTPSLDAPSSQLGTSEPFPPLAPPMTGNPFVGGEVRSDPNAMNARLQKTQIIRRTSKAQAVVAKGLATWNALPPVRKVMVVLLPIAFLAAISLLLEDDPPPASKTTTAETDKPAATSSASESAPTTTPSAAAPAMPVAFISDWPANVPCPPPNWPTNRPPPCTPNGISWPAAPTEPSPSTSAAATTTPTTPTTKDAPKAPTLPAGKKTLEREAVDLYAAGDYLHAAEKYDQLAAENPTNTTYAEAARIVRLRAGGKAP